MICKACGPSILLGTIGLITGIAGILNENSTTLPAAAGIFALGAGWTGVRLGRQLGAEQERNALVAEELADVIHRSKTTEQELEKIKTESQTEVNKTETQPKAPAQTAQTNSTDPLLDSQTGLFSENFFRVALESRIASARRHLRPISVILIEVTSQVENFNSDSIAAAIRETIRDADTACRMDSGEFALVLEDTPETGAIWTVERIRRNLHTAEDSALLWAGLACYPAHAFSRDAIIDAASTALSKAKDWEQGRIEVSDTVEEE